MTIEEAIRVREGDYLISKLSGSLQPRRVTRAWVNEKGTIARFYLHTLASSGWIDSAGLDLPPKGQKWNKQMRRWESPSGIAASA